MAFLSFKIFQEKGKGMFRELLTFLTDLNPKRIIGLIIVIIFLLLFFPFIESKIIQPILLSRQIDNLSKLLQMDAEQIEDNQQLKGIYNRIVENMVNSNIELLSNNPIPIWKKFLSGGALGWLMASIIPFAKFKTIMARFGGLVLVLLIGSIFGGIGILIPDFEIQEINLYLYPGLQIVLLFALAYLVSKKNKAS